MKDSLKSGASRTTTHIVDVEKTIGFMGEDCRVYATPSLVADIEHTCRDLILEHGDDGEDSVGFKVDIAHIAPTLQGMEVTITVTVIEVDRSRVVFDITATDPFDTICKGQHERFVVDVEKTRQKLQMKAAKSS